MQRASTSRHEPERLERLLSLGILDTEAEPLFDALAKAASLVVGVPIGLITLVDATRQWFKANVGLEGTSETSRDVAFCDHTIRSDDLMVIPDASGDERFADNPLVTGDPHIRFYAGAPIVLRDGLRMGALCVIDTRPRRLNEHQAAVMAQLADAAAEALEQRAIALERNEALRREAHTQNTHFQDRDKLARILEATHAGVWEWNVTTGKFIVTEEWAQIFGYSIDELRNLSVSTLQKLTVTGNQAAELEMKLTHPDDWEHVAQRLSEYLAGSRSVFESETRMRHKDGHWVWVLTRGRVSSTLETGAPEWMFGTLVDISERKEIERKLKASEELLERSGKLAGIGGWQLDLATQELTWSDQTCLIHDLPVGYHPTVEEAIHFYAPEAREVMAAAVQKGMTAATDWDLELPLITALGRPIWVRAVGHVEFEQGTASRLVGAFQDVTFRKRAVASLELSERRFRKLFEDSLGLICTHDLEGIILSANPASGEALGYSLAELIGLPFKQLMQPELHKLFDEYLLRIRRVGKDNGLMRLTAKDGSQRTWSYHNRLDDEGDEPFVLAHAQDLTERHRYEKQLREWSVRDSLTGCFNRRYLDELSTSLRPDESWGCIAVDLDRFKLVNDTYGHQRGDEVLVAMGRFLAAHVRPQDVVIRTGGDEFVLLLKGADEQETSAVIDRIHAARAEAPIGFSLGHAIRQDDSPLDSALREADRRLYEIRAARSATH
ncbi:PAS domain S-box protein [Rhodanobacter sp. BL-MT-08]